jgi:hypothetical protein
MHSLHAWRSPQRLCGVAAQQFFLVALVVAAWQCMHPALK